MMLKMIVQTMMMTTNVPIIAKLPYWIYYRQTIYERRRQGQAGLGRQILKGTVSNAFGKSGKVTEMPGNLDTVRGVSGFQLVVAR
jgi:hypothetical protein